MQNHAQYMCVWVVRMPFKHAGGIFFYPKNTAF